MSSVCLVVPCLPLTQGVQGLSKALVYCACSVALLVIFGFAYLHSVRRGGNTIRHRFSPYVQTLVMRYSKLAANESDVASKKRTHSFSQLSPRSSPHTTPSTRFPTTSLPSSSTVVEQPSTDPKLEPPLSLMPPYSTAIHTSNQLNNDESTHRELRHAPDSSICLDTEEKHDCSRFPQLQSVNDLVALLHGVACRPGPHDGAQSRREASGYRVQKLRAAARANRLLSRRSGDSLRREMLAYRHHVRVSAELRVLRVPEMLTLRAKFARYNQVITRRREEADRRRRIEARASKKRAAAAKNQKSTRQRSARIMNVLRVVVRPKGTQNGKSAKNQTLIISPTKSASQPTILPPPQQQKQKSMRKKSQPEKMIISSPMALIA